ncbi:hypothetical protein ACSBR1_035412 [Camellia fascicularis]
MGSSDRLFNRHRTVHQILGGGLDGTGQTCTRFSNQCSSDQAHRGTCTKVQRGSGSPPANPLTSKLEREMDCRDGLEIEKLNLFLVFDVCLYPLVIISLSLPTCHLGRKSML